MPRGNKGIQAKQQERRRKIAEWHISHDVTQAETARKFGCSAYVVHKALVECGYDVPAGGTNRSSIRNDHINLCVQALLEITDEMDIASKADKYWLKLQQSRITKYKDSLETGGTVHPEFFRSSAFPVREPEIA